mmetsp:Transcript_54259/g.124457  ORF Transcript_54259/g.124457 Transcript_54259/m.124457 type:complete len:478 (-) Transcript_54259:297-1730(-)
MACYDVGSAAANCAFGCWGVLVITSIILFSSSFTTLDPNQVALEYNSFSRVLTNDKVYLAGRHFLGLGKSFEGTSGSLAIPTTWQKLSFCTYCPTRDGPDIDGYTEDSTQSSAGDSGSRNVVQVSIEIHAFYRLRESLLVELIRKFPQRNWKSRYTFVIKNQVLEVLSTSKLDDLLQFREAFQQRMAEKINDAFTTTEVQIAGLNPANYVQGQQLIQGDSFGTIMKPVTNKELRLRGLSPGIVFAPGQSEIVQGSSVRGRVDGLDAESGDLLVMVLSDATFEPSVACQIDGEDVGSPSNVYSIDVSITQDRGAFVRGVDIIMNGASVGSPSDIEIQDYRVYGQLVALYYGAVQLDERIEDLFLERWLTKQKQIKAGVTGATDLYKADTDKMRAVIEREEKELASKFEVINKETLANGTAFGDRLILEAQVNGYVAMRRNLDMDNENLLKLIYYRKLWESANSVVAGFEGSSQLLSTL